LEVRETSLIFTKSSQGWARKYLDPKHTFYVVAGTWRLWRILLSLTEFWSSFWNQAEKQPRL
jgi:hypothetical protein